MAEGTGEQPKPWRLEKAPIAAPPKSAREEGARGGVIETAVKNKLPAGEGKKAAAAEGLKFVAVRLSSGEEMEVSESDLPAIEEALRQAETRRELSRSAGVEDAELDATIREFKNILAEVAIAERAGGSQKDGRGVRVKKGESLARREVQPEKELTEESKISRLAEGLANLGFLVKEKKGQALGELYGWMAEKTAKPGEEKAERGAVPRLFAAYADLYRREAEEAKRALETSKSARGRIAGIGALAANSLYYGRLLFDLGVANPFRHLTAASMFLGRGAEAVKEARFAGKEIVEKTRVADIDQAYEEAMRVYERAEEKAGGGSLTGEDLSRAYQSFLPQDLKERLGVYPDTAMSLAERVARWGVERKVNRLAAKMDYMEQSPDFSPEERREAEAKILRRNQSFLRDMDRMIAQAGTIDLVSFGARNLEKGAKAAAVALAVESLGRIMANVFEAVEAHAAEADPAETGAAAGAANGAAPDAATPSSPENLKKLLEKEAWHTLEVKRGDSPLKLMQNFYREHIDKIAPRFGVDPASFADESEMRRWVETAATRSIVGQFIVEYGSSAAERPNPAAKALYEKMLAAAGQGDKVVDWNSAEDMNKALSSLSKDEFNSFLRESVPNLIHPGDKLTVADNGHIVFVDPESPRGHIAAVAAGQGKPKTASLLTPLAEGERPSAGRGLKEMTTAPGSGTKAAASVLEEVTGKKVQDIVKHPVFNNEAFREDLEARGSVPSFEKCVDSILPEVRKYCDEDEAKLGELVDHFHNNGRHISAGEASRAVDSFSSETISSLGKSEDVSKLKEALAVSDYLRGEFAGEEAAEVFKKLSDLLEYRIVELNVNGALRASKDLLKAGDPNSETMFGQLAQYFTDRGAKLKNEELRELVRDFSSATAEKVQAMKDFVKFRRFALVAEFLSKEKKTEPFGMLNDFFQIGLEARER